MKSQQELKYVRKTYQILIYSITFQNHFKMHFHSDKTATEHFVVSEASTKIGKCFQIHAVDVIYQTKRTTDSLIHLQLYSNEVAVSTVTFDLRKEKFVKDDSKSLFRKTFNDKSGFIDYKFISAKTDIITSEQFASCQLNRNKVLLRKNENFETIKKENLQYEIIQKEKDKMIHSLQEKMNSLLLQNIELNKRVNEDFEKLKKPLNINVNIQTKKQRLDRAMSSQGRNIDKIMKENEGFKSHIELLTDKLTHVGVDNKKLMQSCRILIEQIRNNETSVDKGNTKVKDIEKKISQIDNGYMLTKTISNYDKNFRKNFQQEDHINEINQLLESSLQKLDRVDMMSSGKSARSRPMQESYTRRIPAQIQKDMKSSKIAIELKASLMKDSMKSVPREDAAVLVAQLQRKQKEVEILENQLKKKQIYIQKLLHQQNEYEKQYQEYQEQKSKVLANLAMSTLASGKSTPDQISSIKQLASYNAQLIKQKQLLLDQLKQLKLENNLKTKKIETFEITTRKSLLFMSQISKEKEFLEQKYKETVEGEKALENKFLAQKGEQYDVLKQQFIECSQELNVAKKQSLALQEVDISHQQQKITMQTELQALRLEKQKLQIIVDQQHSYQAQIKLLQDKYEQIQKYQKGIKSFVLRLESQMNLTSKKQDEQIYQAEMKSLLKQTYSKINEFEHDYYQVLIDAAKINEESIQKYYDSIGKYQDEAETIQKKQQMWNNRINLLKQRQAKLKVISQKQQIYKQKQQKKLLFIEDEFQNFMDNFKILNSRLNQMQAYKLSLREILKDGKATSYHHQDKQNSSISSIQQKDLLPFASSNVSNLGRGSNMIKSMIKSKVQLKNVRIQQQRDEEQCEQKSRRSIFQDKNKAYRESILLTKQAQSSRIVKFQDDNLRLKQSLTQNLSLREQMAREKLQLKKKQSRMMQAQNEKVREIEKQLMIEKSEKESLSIRLRQSESQLQRSLKKVQNEVQMKIQNTEKQVQQIKEQSASLIEQVASLQNLLIKAGEQITFLASQQKIKQEEIQKLMQQQENLISQLKSYQQAESYLIQQVKQMKETQRINQQEINRYLEERSDQFIKIQKIKSTEIEKLKGIIEQMDEKLESEANDNMKNRDKIEELNEQILQNNNRMMQQREEMQMMLETMEKEVNHERDLKENLEHQNNEYYRNIVELSQSIAAHQKEILRLHIIIDAHNKQKIMLQEISAKLSQKESSMKQESKKLDKIVREKSDQIKKWEGNYQKLQQEIKYLNREFQNTKTENATQKDDIQKLRDDLFLKQRQILQVDKEKGIALINIQKMKIEVDCMSTQIIIQENKIKELIQINEQLINEVRISEKGHIRGNSRLGESKRELMVSKAFSKDMKDREDADSFLSRSKQMGKQMKFSRKIPQLFMSTMSSRVAQSPKGDKSKTLLVPVMKHNKMLNLPSIDSDPVYDQELNLQIIEERHDELNDTFLNDQQQTMEIIVNNEQRQMIEHQTQSINLAQRADQSGIHIQLPDQVDDDDVMWNYHNAHQFTHKNTPEHYNSNTNAELIDEIIRLKKVITEIQNKRETPLNTSRSKEIPLGQFSRSERSYYSSNEENHQARKHEKSFRIQRQGSNNVDSPSHPNFDERVKELESENQSLNMNLMKLKDKETHDELYIAQVEQKLRMAEKSIQEEEKNVDDLMNELKKISELNCHLQSQIENVNKEMVKLNQKHKKQRLIFEQEREELISEGLKKDEIIYELQIQKGKSKQKVEKSLALVVQHEQIAKKAGKRSKEYEQKLKKQQASYINYEEQSELQILKLKQEVDSIKLSLHHKQEQFMLLGEKYIELQEVNQSLLLDLKQQEMQNDKSEKLNEGLCSKFQSVKGEIEGNETFRKNTMKKLKEMELQNYRLAQRITNANKAAAIESQKWDIRLKAEQETIKSYQEKLKDKERVILQLKHQIAVYNEECDQLKKLNESLSNEMAKVKREVKDIMVQYDAQLQQANKLANSKSATTNEIAINLRNLQKDIDIKEREIRKCKDEIKQLNEENRDILNKWQALKLDHNRLRANISNELELKKDECEKLRSDLIMAEKSVEEMKKAEFSSECNINQTIRQFQNQANRLQVQNEELKEKIENLAKRPTSQRLNKSELMVSILETKLKELSDKFELQKNKKIEADSNIQQEQSQQIIQSCQNQIVKLSHTVVLQKQKNNTIYAQLKQVIKAFKKLEDDYSSLKEKNEKLKRSNNSISIQYRQIERRQKQLETMNKELQKDNEEMHRELSNIRFSRLQSFSKSNADTTIK